MMPDAWQKNHDDWRIPEALWERIGCPWRALEATGTCSHRAAHRRCQEWGEADVFVAIWEQGLVA